MKNEIIREILVNDHKELFLKLVSQGNSMYQYIYREAAGVYWDENQKAFKSTPINEWTVSDWFLHIREIVKSGLNIELSIDENTVWKNVTDEEKNKIKISLQQ